MEAILTVSGNLGTEVDHRTFEGYNRASFRLASTPRVRRGQEWVDGQTTWITVECNNRLADNVRDSFEKGDPVVVTGRLRTRVWTHEGTRYERLVVEATALGHDVSRGVSVFTTRTSYEQGAELGESAAEATAATDDSQSDEVAA